MGLKDIAVSRRDGFNIDPRTIKVLDGFNARDFSLPENIAHVNDLKASIKANGILTPLTIRLLADEPWLIDGESRLRAVLGLIEDGVDIKSVPTQAELRGESDERRTIGLVARNSGKQLNMMEQGNVYRRMLVYGWSEAQIADGAGKSLTHIQNCLTLLEQPAEIQDHIRQGNVSASTVAKEARKGGGKGLFERVTTAVQKAQESGKKKASAADVATAADPTAALGPEHIKYLVDILNFIADGGAEPQKTATDALTRMGVRKATPPPAADPIEGLAAAE